MVTGSTRGVPVHRLAWVGITTAVLAGVLALYGSMEAEKHIAGSPLRAARTDPKVPPQPGSWAERQLVRGETGVFGERIDSKFRTLTHNSKIANYMLQLVAYVLPFVLGIGAALTGCAAMNAVERSGGRYVGYTLAVFSMLAGGLAAVVAGCMMVTLYVWPHVPALYTA